MKNIMGTGKRLSYYIEKQGFKKKEFCELYGIDYNSFVRILADKRAIGINVLNQVHEALPKLNVHWALYDQGPMEYDGVNYVNEESEKYTPTRREFEGLLVEYLKKDNIKELLQNLLKDEEKK